METLKLLQERKREKNLTMMPEDLIDSFPLPRYFQVHFQHIHENTLELKGELVQLKQAVAKVDEKLDHLTALLSRFSGDRF